jgi:hypothetical protein
LEKARSQREIIKLLRGPQINGVLAQPLRVFSAPRDPPAKRYPRIAILINSYQ